MAGQTPLLGDQLGPDALVELLDTVPVQNRLPVREAGGAGGPERYPRHCLHTTGDGDVVGAGDHRVRGRLDGLLPRTAGAVDGHTGHRLRPARGQHTEPGNVAGLVAELGDTPPHHIVDEHRINTGTPYQFGQHQRGQVHRVHPGE
jgi:hypothetical protein